MIRMKFSSQTVTVKCFDGSGMIAYIATPKTNGRQPAIIVVHEAWGLNEQIKGVANRYAEQGFVSIAPHLFSREKDLLTEQAIEKAMMHIWKIPPEKRGDSDAVQSLMKDLPENDQKVVNYFFTGRENAEKIMAQDLLCCINYLKNEEAVEPESLGITGFCLGGGLTYQLATMYPFKAAIPFYGANPKPLEAVEKINGPVFGVYAGEDQRITSGVPALVESMIKYKKTFQMKIYQGAQHAFLNENRPSYNKAAAEDAWTMTLEFFNKYLKATQ
jgi:carboxymethylenebutenolidase